MKNALAIGCAAYFTQHFFFTTASYLAPDTASFHASEVHKEGCVFLGHLAEGDNHHNLGT